MSEVAAQDPILTPSESRYVMFPIQDNEIWQMYKKQVDCFWRAEEIDFSKDLTDWNTKLNNDERYFISMILAFFSNADGVVSENLAMKFMNDVQLSEARAFYGFQIAMENIHCVVGSTKILTDKGYYHIQDIVDKTVNIWNGEEFTEVDIKYTGHQAIFKVKLSNGIELDCTSGHKWLVIQGDTSKPDRIETNKLQIDDVLAKFDLPVANFEDPDEFMNPYMHGFFCADGAYVNNLSIVYLYDNKKDLLSYFNYHSISTINDMYKIDISEYINKEKMEVPINYNVETKLRWLEGLMDAAGSINLDDNFDFSSIQLILYNAHFTKNVQLLLTTLGVQSVVNEFAEPTQTLLPKNDGTSEYAVYNSNKSYVLYMSDKYVSQLMNMGLQTKRLQLNACPFKTNNSADGVNIQPDLPIYVKRIQHISENEATYCFNEPKLHTGIFNGILTGQSETYSIMIDTYIKDKVQQNKMFNAVEHFPCIAKKTTWAKKWISDKKSPFAARLVAFAVVEGIFFSASFASIYWLKKRGLLPGLTFSNELISRDEAMHCEFAVLIYSKLTKKLTKKRVYEIVQEAVEIEKEFITEAIPCRLIGMNTKLMCQYIEFVADRLCLQLGYDKIYNSSNPFDFMELISIESKVNFFERTNSEYALANKTIDEDIFKFTADF